MGMDSSLSSGLNSLNLRPLVRSFIVLPMIDILAPYFAAAKYGASISIIGNTIKLLTSGLKLSEFRPDDSDESIPIYLRLPKEQRTIDQLDNIKIPTSSGYVPISNFTKIETNQETGNLTRVEQNRIETIKSDVTRFYQTDAYVRLIKHWPMFD